MSINLPTLYVSQFANTLELLAQQTESKLQSTVMYSGGHVGKQASPVDQYGKIEASENTERFGPMPRTDAPVDRRWIFPRNWDLNQQIDQNDLQRVLLDPKAILARDALAAMNRRKDSVILDALTGANFTGETGIVSTTLPATQVVGVSTGGTASSLNVAKIRAGKKILMQNDVDVMAEELYLAVNAKAYDSLFAEVQITNKDYNEARDGKPIMQEGLITRFMGINIVHLERIQSGTDDIAGTSDQCFMYAKSGVHLGGWQEIETSINPRYDLRGIPWQIYVKMTMGATRLQETKVVKIWTR